MFSDALNGLFYIKFRHSCSSYKQLLCKVRPEYNCLENTWSCTVNTVSLIKRAKTMQLMQHAKNQINFVIFFHRSGKTTN